MLGRRYRLLSRIGRGGMGTVWHGHDDLLDRDVAVKEVLFPPGLTDAEREVLYERTLREARSAARLTHPGIVTVHDVVEEDGRPCIVMEFVRARSLQEVIDGGERLSPVQVAEIGGQVLAALRAAHVAGILHRDVKPANVLLATDSPDEPVSAATRVVITDFGIATMEGDAALTQTGLVLGSPAYISPERARGEKAAPASDLWSLGATLYAACDGRPPHYRTEAMAALTAVLSEDAPPPRHAGPLTPVVMGLLAREPAVRMPAERAAEELRRVARQVGPLPPPTTDATAPAGDPEVALRGRTSPGTPAPGGPGSGADGSRAGRSEAYGPDTYPSRLHGPESSGGPAGAGAPSMDATMASGPWTPGYDQTVDGRDRPVPDRPARGRSGMLAVGVLALLAAVVVAVVVLRPSSGGSADTPTASPSVPTGSPGTSSTGSPVTGTVPQGYHWVSAPAGSSLALPVGWVRTAIRDRSVTWTDPATGVYLQVDTTPWEDADPARHWRRFAVQARSGRNLPGFRLETAGGNVTRGRQIMADIEFTWDSGAGRTRGLDRGVTVDGRQYAVFVAGPAATWHAHRALAVQIVSSFRPGP